MKRIFMMLTLGCFVFLPLAVESASGHQATADQKTCAMGDHGCCNRPQAADTSTAGSTMQDQVATPAARPASRCGENCPCCAMKDGSQMKCDMPGMKDMQGMKDMPGMKMDSPSIPGVKRGKDDCAQCSKTPKNASDGK